MGCIDWTSYSVYQRPCRCRMLWSFFTQTNYFFITRIISWIFKLIDSLVTATQRQRQQRAWGRDETTPHGLIVERLWVFAKMRMMIILSNFRDDFFFQSSTSFCSSTCRWDNSVDKWKWNEIILCPIISKGRPDSIVEWLQSLEMSTGGTTTSVDKCRRDEKQTIYLTLRGIKSGKQYQRVQKWVRWWWWWGRWPMLG